MNNKKLIICLIFFMLVFLNYAKTQSLFAYIETTGGKNEFCTNQIITLVGQTENGSGSFLNHTWMGNNEMIIKTIENVAIIKSNKSGSYQFTYTVKDNTGEEATVNITIFFKESPFANLVISNNEILINNIVSAGEPKYTWFLNGKEIEVSEKRLQSVENGEYKVVITDGNGCSFATKKVMYSK
ncbi:MAG: hypothetical protein EHM93_07985 [Bacteroidales bacterium]|nr:MAG: hypothetical protein EHM93_07985 [Bacteroidales bacterium]